MTREELDFIGSMNMCDEISNEAYKKIVCHCEEQEPCEDAISRQAALDTIESWLSCDDYNEAERHIMRATQSVLYDLPSVTPKQRTGHCRDCKWWKDSDETYRRGVKAESQCPINRKEVYEGNGYCFLFEPQESEGNNG